MIINYNRKQTKIIKYLIIYITGRENKTNIEVQLNYKFG